MSFSKSWNCTGRSGSCCNFSFLKNSHVQINSKLISKLYNYLYKAHSGIDHQKYTVPLLEYKKTLNKECLYQANPSFFGQWQPNIWLSGQIWNLEPKILVLVWVCVERVTRVIPPCLKTSPTGFDSCYMYHLKEMSPLATRLFHHFDFKTASGLNVALCFCHTCSHTLWELL